MTGLSNLALRELGVDEIIGGGGKVDDRNPSKSKKLKNVKSGIQTRIEAIGELIFLISDTKKVFD